MPMVAALFRPISSADGSTWTSAASFPMVGGMA